MTTGYSGTPLAKKLGIKEGFYVYVINAPANFIDLLRPLPPNVEIVDVSRKNADVAHLFTNDHTDLQKTLSELRKTIRQDGAIWVSWYKKASKLPTEITEDLIREVAFPLGLVDVKVCAVDENWSGLKLVIRKENRV
jgi:hypothetical protein